MIESLKDEKQTGKELYDDIIRVWCEHKNIYAEFVEVQSLKDWRDIITQIKQEVRDNHIIPIIHFELHGRKNDGLILANEDLVPWEHFVSDMRCINIGTENNLFITMGICFGMDILFHTPLDKPAPFFGIVGSLHTLFIDDIYIRYHEFYNEFLQSLYLTKSLNALFKANPDRPQEYSFVNTPKLFSRIYKKYLYTQCSPEGTKKRINKIIDDMGVSSPQERKDLEDQIQKKFNDTKEPYYQQHIRSFLMVDQFESCKKRFEIPETTEELLSYEWTHSIPNIIN